jgi:phosphoenolpyruvate-protein phosphotransferase (PTS system enzyme I)
LSAKPGTIFSGLGVGLSPAQGEVLVIERSQGLPEWTKSTKTTEQENSDLTGAIADVANQLDELAAKSEDTSREIFEALKVLLEDNELLEASKSNIAQGWSAAASFGKAVDGFSELLNGNPTFEERIADLQDLSKRVQARLAGITLELDLPATGQIVLVGEDFSPADTAQFTNAVVGVVTIKGGPTSHTAIICKSRNIAAVVSCHAAIELSSGDQVLVDPVGDRVIVTDDVSLATQAISFSPIEDTSLIPVRANIGTLDDAVSASQTLADGVGLFRTELLYLSSTREPSIDDQAQSYSEILSAAPKGPIVVRTLDPGSDKPVPFLNLPSEEGPLLGSRGYRLLTNYREFVEGQLKALEIARKQTSREVWVMAPMISTLDEAKTFAQLAKSIGKYKVGIMIETPSITTVIDQLSGVLDFVSVGTNDLSQYLFAESRMNTSHGAHINHWQPSLIQALARIANDARKAGISSSVCGESASDTAFVILLAGLGFNSVSVSGSQVNAVHNALSSLDLLTAQRVAKKVLLASSAEQAKATALREIGVR